MHLSAAVSGLRVRQNTDGTRRYKETGNPWRKGAGRKSPFKEREAQGIRAGIWFASQERAMAARRQISAGHRRVNSQRTVYRASAASGSGMRRTYAGAGNSNRGRDIRLDTYEDGNAVRRLDEETEEVERPRKKRQVSRRTRENRERAMNVGIGYILFLTAVCIASVYFCIHYLQLRSELINQNETIAAMQNDLSKLTTDNDALYKNARLGQRLPICIR